MVEEGIFVDLAAREMCIAEGLRFHYMGLGLRFLLFVTKRPFVHEFKSTTFSHSFFKIFIENLLIFFIYFLLSLMCRVFGFPLRC